MKLVILLIASLIALLFLAFVFLYLGFLTFSFYLAILVLIIVIGILIAFMIEFYRIIFKGAAPYVRSSEKVINKILQEIDFKANSLVYDLGCGDARFLRALVKKVKIQAVGYEYFIIPYLLAKGLNFFSGSKIKVYWQDFFKVDLSKADYVFCYLIPDEHIPLSIKFKKELKPGAIIIANTFKFKDWQPEKIIIIDENKKTGLSSKIYIYRK